MATEGTTQPSAGAAQEDASTSAPSSDPHPTAGPPDASALDIDFSATEDTDDDDDNLDLEIEVEIDQPHEMTQGGDVPTEEQSSPMLPSSSADGAAAESAAEAPAVAAGEGAGSDSAGQDAAGEQTEVQGADQGGDSALNDTAGTDLTENVGDLPSRSRPHIRVAVCTSLRYESCASMFRKYNLWDCLNLDSSCMIA